MITLLTNVSSDEPALSRCEACGGTSFRHTPVLWSSLIAEWGLDDEEVRYIDVQQGTHCVDCGANVRSMALARAIVRFRGHAGPLSTFVEDSAQSKLRVLEINEAGTLNPLLSRLPGHRLLSFPEFDMANLAIPTNAVDLVVHSDTLEHVPDPLKGLCECRRVIDNQGAVIFTVPIVIGRLSRGREGLPPSYHGQRESTDSAMRVHTEFGADVWTFVVRAGFTSCELVPFLFPAGLAVVARP